MTLDIRRTLTGQPLELVNLGQTKASLRLDSRYIKDVLQRTETATVVVLPSASTAIVVLPSAIGMMILALTLAMRSSATR